MVVHESEVPFCLGNIICVMIRQCLSYTVKCEVKWIPDNNPRLTKLPARIPQVSILLMVFLCANNKKVVITFDGIRTVRRPALRVELNIDDGLLLRSIDGAECMLKYKFELIPIRIYSITVLLLRIWIYCRCRSDSIRNGGCRIIVRIPDRF